VSLEAIALPAPRWPSLKAGDRVLIAGDLSVGGGPTHPTVQGMVASIERRFDPYHDPRTPWAGHAYKAWTTVLIVFDGQDAPTLFWPLRTGIPYACVWRGQVVGVTIQKIRR
jgi:hypothetical protein